MYMYMYMYRRTYRHTNINRLIYVHVHVHVQTYLQTHKYKQTHLCTCTCTDVLTENRLIYVHVHMFIVRNSWYCLQQAHLKQMIIYLVSLEQSRYISHMTVMWRSCDNYFIKETTVTRDCSIYWGEFVTSRRGKPLTI